MSESYQIASDLGSAATGRRKGRQAGLGDLGPSGYRHLLSAETLASISAQEKKTQDELKSLEVVR